MAESFMDRMRRSSHLDGNNLAYVEALYETFLGDPYAVPAEWRDYFEKLPRVEGAIKADVPHSSVVQYFERLGRNRLKARPARESTRVESAHEQKQMRVQDLIAAYRHRGHKKAHIDPLGMMERPAMPILDLAYHNLSPADLEETFHTGTFHYGEGTAKLRELVDALERTYCSSIGSEYMHIVDASEQLWVQQRLETVRARPRYTPEQKRTILERLTAAEGLEKYLHGRYPGTKRFGLEGAESLLDRWRRREAPHQRVDAATLHKIGQLAQLLGPLGALLELSLHIIFTHHDSPLRYSTSAITLIARATDPHKISTSEALRCVALSAMSSTPPILASISAGPPSTRAASATRGRRCSPSAPAPRSRP
jgi:hypothetical protein